MTDLNEFNVEILSHTVKVIFDSPKHWTSSGLGRAELKDLTVRVNSDCATDIRNSVLMHEILHIIADLFSIELEEYEVDIMANGIYSFIKDNPSVIKMIQGNE